MYYSIRCNESELLILQSMMSVISSDEHFKSNMGWMVTPEEIVEKAKEKQGKNFDLTQKEADDPFDNRNIFSVFFGED